LCSGLEFGDFYCWWMIVLGLVLDYTFPIVLIRVMGEVPFTFLGGCLVFDAMIVWIWRYYGILPLDGDFLPDLWPVRTGDIALLLWSGRWWPYLFGDPILPQIYSVIWTIACYYCCLLCHLIPLNLLPGPWRWLEVVSPKLLIVILLLFCLLTSRWLYDECSGWPDIWEIVDFDLWWYYRLFVASASSSLRCCYRCLLLLIYSGGYFLPIRWLLLLQFHYRCVIRLQFWPTVEVKVRYRCWPYDTWLTVIQTVVVGMTFDAGGIDRFYWWYSGDFTCYSRLRWWYSQFIRCYSLFDGGDYDCGYDGDIVDWWCWLRYSDILLLFLQWCSVDGLIRLWCCWLLMFGITGLTWCRLLLFYVYWNTIVVLVMIVTNFCAIICWYGDYWWWLFDYPHWWLLFYSSMGIRYCSVWEVIHSLPL